jgi:hypothetical protein
MIAPDEPWRLFTYLGRGDGAGDGATTLNFADALDADERIGNGTAFLRLRRAAHLLIFNLNFTPGSTTSFGTGGFADLVFQLPALFSAADAQQFAVSAYLANGASLWSGVGLVTQSGAYWSNPTLTTILGTTPLTPTAPTTLGVNSFLAVTGCVEAFGT